MSDFVSHYGQRSIFTQDNISRDSLDSDLCLFHDAEESISAYQEDKSISEYSPVSSSFRQRKPATIKITVRDDELGNPANQYSYDSATMTPSSETYKLTTFSELAEAKANLSVLSSNSTEVYSCQSSRPKIAAEISPDASFTFECKSKKGSSKFSPSSSKNSNKKKTAHGMITVSTPQMSHVDSPILSPLRLSKPEPIKIRRVAKKKSKFCISNLSSLNIANVNTQPRSIPQSQLALDIQSLADSSLTKPQPSSSNQSSTKPTIINNIVTASPKSQQSISQPSSGLKSKFTFGFRKSTDSKKHTGNSEDPILLTNSPLDKYAFNRLECF